MIYSRSMALTIESARNFLFEHHQAFLGTVMDTGAHAEGAASAQPYVSAVNMVASHDSCLLLQVSRLAVHSHNLLANRACSLLLMSPDQEDFQQSPRLSVQGVAREVESHLADRYLRLFPHSRAYLDLDFYCLAVDIKEARWIEGFARAEWIEGRDLCPSSASGDLTAWNDESERALIDAVAAEFMPALQRFSDGVSSSSVDNNTLSGHTANLGAVALAAIDPWGLWLLCDGQPRRLSFDLPVQHPSRVRATIVEMLGGAE